MFLSKNWYQSTGYDLNKDSEVGAKFEEIGCDFRYGFPWSSTWMFSSHG